MTAPPRTSPHWKRLGLLEGAPECAIEAAWLWQISRHHPDRGGDPEVARAINVAHDELKGTGSKPNEYVAKHYESQPWLVLGVARDAETDLVRRVGAQLAGSLSAHRRLADRVAWAVANFDARVAPPAGGAPRVRVTPPPPPRPRPVRTPAARPPQPATPGMPDGLPPRVDFGTVSWGDDAPQTIKLTWRRHAPFDVKVEAPAPLRADVAASKALPGRFVITLTIDWEHDAFTHNPSLRGHTFDGAVVVRWAGGGESAIPVRGIALYPAQVSVSPLSLDLGTVTASDPARAALALISTGATVVSIQTPAWLQRVDGDGRALTSDVRLAANTPVRIEFSVLWPPILDRAAASFAQGRPVRPTGKVTVSWNDHALEVPAQVVVRPPASTRKR